MREFINIVESAQGIPSVVYHGTSRTRWANDRSSPEGLYVTINREVALDYAKEWEEEGEEGMLVEISLAGFDPSEFGPNEETVEQVEDGSWGDIGKSGVEMTWLDTLRLNGTFTIRHFGESHKNAVSVKPINEDADINSPDYDGLSYDRSDPVVKKYVEGLCYALAVAHNRRYGWPIYCLGADDNDYAEYGEDTDFFHGMVMHPTGVVLDITGPHLPQAFIENWGEPIFRMGDEAALLRHLNDFMRKETLSGAAEASRIIDTYLKPRWPGLYED